MRGEGGGGRGEKKCQKAIAKADTVLFLKREKYETRERDTEQEPVPGAVSRGDPVPAPTSSISLPTFD